MFFLPRISQIAQIQGAGKAFFRKKINFMPLPLIARSAAESVAFFQSVFRHGGPRNPWLIFNLCNQRNLWLFFNPCSAAADREIRGLLLICEICS